MEDKNYENLKEDVLKVKIYDIASDYAKKRVISYFEMGELLSNVGREYGKKLLIIIQKTCA